MVSRIATASAWSIAASLALFLGACGGGSSQSPMDSGAADVDLATCVASGLLGPRDNCPTGLPDGGDCPTASPVYDDVAPIFAARCTICHHPGGLVTKLQFDSYSAIHDTPTIRSDIFFQIYRCRMPPSCAPNLHPDERSALLEWFICGDQVSRDAGAEVDTVEDAAADDATER
jgi:hypothetical protein